MTLGDDKPVGDADMATPWRGREYRAFIEGQVQMLARLLKAGAISLGVTEIDMDRLPEEPIDLLIERIIDVIEDVGVLEGCFFQVDDLNSDDQRLVVAIASSQERLQELRPLVKLTDPVIYYKQLESLLSRKGQE